MKKLILINLSIFLVLLIILELVINLFFNGNLTFSERKLATLEYEKDSLLGFKLKANQRVFQQSKGKLFEDYLKFKIGKNGFRNSSDSAYDIIFLGGSHVFDINAFESRGNLGFVDEFERCPPYYSTLNAGVPGYDLNEIEKMLPLLVVNYKPSKIVICSEWNDLKNLCSENPELEYIQNFSPSKNPMVDKMNTMDDLFGFSILYRKIRDVYWKSKLGINTSHLQENKAIGNKYTVPNINLYTERIKRIQAFCKQKDIELYYMKEHSLLSQRAKNAKVKINFSLINNLPFIELRKFDSLIVLETQKLFDLKHYIYIAKIEEDLSNFTDHVHLSDQGSKLLARKLYEFQYLQEYEECCFKIDSLKNGRNLKVTINW